MEFVATEGQFAGLYFRVISHELVLITTVAPCASVAALALYIRFIRRTIPSKPNIVYIGPRTFVSLTNQPLHKYLHLQRVHPRLSYKKDAKLNILHGSNMNEIQRRWISDVHGD